MQEEGILPAFVVHKADGLPAQLRGGGKLAVTNQKGSCFRQEEYHDGSPQGLLAPCGMRSYPAIRDVGKSQEERRAFQEFPVEEFSSQGQHDLQFAISDIDLMPNNRHTPLAQEHNFLGMFQPVQFVVTRRLPDKLDCAIRPPDILSILVPQAH